MSESPPTTRQQEQQEIVAVAMDLARDGRTADLAPFRVLVAAGADLDAGSPTARETARLFGQLHLIDGQE